MLHSPFSLYSPLHSSGLSLVRQANEANKCEGGKGLFLSFSSCWVVSPFWLRLPLDLRRRDEKFLGSFFILFSLPFGTSITSLSKLALPPPTERSQVLSRYLLLTAKKTPTKISVDIQMSIDRELSLYTWVKKTPQQEQGRHPPPPTLLTIADTSNPTRVLLSLPPQLRGILQYKNTHTWDSSL